MKRLPFGKSGINVSRLGLGCATFGREVDQQTSFAIMDAALEAGITLFDTAESYGGGQAQEYRRSLLGIDDVREVGSEMHSSEKIIGRWLKSRGTRKQILLQTKVTTNFTLSHVREALDFSLERLQTDYVDVYLFHAFDLQTPLEEGLEAMTQAKRHGRILAAGASNFTAAQLQETLELAHASHLCAPSVVEPLYNLVSRDIEKDLLPLCRDGSVGVVSYSPLGAGFLTGKYSGDRNAIPKGTRFDVIPGHISIYFTGEKFRVLEQLRGMSERVGISMVQLALGWVLQQPDICSTLIGARSIGHLENALRALSMEFPEEWLQEMNQWR